MKSPFKFLDSYTREDHKLFFGRKKEIEELYQRVFEGNILLVYGVSGTGKSSLIHCGLANKFNETDWLPLPIRRSQNIIESMASSVRSASITHQPDEISSPAQFRKSVKSLYLDHYKPVYLIFDQFEELFIFGNKEEKKAFVQIVKTLIDSDLQCRFIFVMREEYMAGITEFEKYIPTFFANRVRIEKMSHLNAIEAIEGPCHESEIDIAEGFAESLLERLSPDSGDVELTYLQVFLDKIFRLGQEGQKEESERISFTLDLLQKTGNVSDLLGSFLDEQIALLEDQDTGLAVLKSFVSIKGTKKQMSPREVIEYAQTMGKTIDESMLQEILHSFIKLRILRDKDQNGKYELRHDALATKIYEKITLVEKEILEIRQFVENAWNSWLKRGVLISVADLKYIAPYESRLYLSKEISGLIEKSKRFSLIARKRRRIVLSTALAVLIVVLSGFTLWALKERDKAREQRNSAIALKYNFQAKKMVADNPTKALRVAEYALSLDSNNLYILRDLERIYYDYPMHLTLAKHNDRVNSVAISPDGKTVLTGSSDQIAKLSDLQGNLIRVFKGHTGKIFSVAFSPDGRKVLTGSSDFTSRLWDLSGNLLQIYKGHTSAILSVTFSPDGQNILSGSYDNTARLFDLSGNLIRIFKGHTNAITSVAFSPDGKDVITGSLDNTVRLWNSNGSLIHIFKNPLAENMRDGIWAVSFSPDGNKILSGNYNGTACLWNLHGELISQFKGHSSGIRSVAFSPDGLKVLTGSEDQSTKLWDLHGNLLQTVTGQDGSVYSALFFPDGKKIITASADMSARIWYLQGNLLQIIGEQKNPVTSVVYSPDGQKILSISDDNTIRLWNLHGDLIKLFRGHSSIITSVAFSPDGQKIVSGSYDNTARLWDIDGNLIQVFKGHIYPVTSVAFSPDGQKILTGSDDYTARLWDIKGNLLQIFKGHKNSIRSVAFSPEGQKILTGSDDKTAIIWDINGDWRRILGGHTNTVSSVAFSPDGQEILSGSLDKTARLFGIKGNLLQIYKGHTNGITSLAFSPDGKEIVTGSDDYTARLWDLKGDLLQIFRGHTNSIRSVAFSPDGGEMLSGSDDHTARLWSLKAPYPEFRRNNNYERLEIREKLEFDILSFSQCLELDNESELNVAADFFIKESEQMNLKEKEQYLNNAIELLRKLTIKDPNNTGYFLNLLKESCDLYELNPSNKGMLEIGKIQDRILRFSTADDMLMSFNYYQRLCTPLDSLKIELRIPDDCIRLCENLSKTENLPDSSRYALREWCSDFSYNLIENREFAASLKSVKLSLQLDSTYEIAYSNLPLAYILNNDFNEASKVYMKWKDKRWTTDESYQTFREAFLTDINDLESKGIYHPDFEKVKKLLNK
jgi:WD40 repeat protein